MYGEQQDNSNFALDPRVLLALAGGAVAGGLGKKYATRELGKGFESSYNRTLARLQEAVAAKDAARGISAAELANAKKFAKPEELALKQAAYDASGKAHQAALAEQMSEGLAAKQRLGDKNEWVNEMGLAVGGVPAAMLGYGIGSGVMRKKDDDNPYQNPLR